MKFNKQNLSIKILNYAYTQKFQPKQPDVIIFNHKSNCASNKMIQIHFIFITF